MFNNMTTMPQSLFTFEAEGASSGGSVAVAEPASAEPRSKSSAEIAKSVTEKLMASEAGRDETEKPASSEPGNKTPASTDDQGGSDKTPEPKASVLPEGDKALLDWAKSLDPKTLDDIKAGKALPKHRFDEVLGELKSYQSLGTLDNLKKALEAAKSPAKPETSEVDPDLPEEDRQTQEYMLKLLLPKLEKIFKGDPEKDAKIAEIEKEFESMKSEKKQQAEARHQSIVKSGTEKIKALAAEKGLPVANDKQLKLIINNVVDLLHESPELAQKFYKDGDVEILVQPFNDYYETLFSGFQVKAAAKILSDKKNGEQISKTPPKGGVPEAALKDSKPKSWAQLREATASKL